MSQIVKEIIYFILTSLLVVILSILIFGIENLQSGAVDINIHATYFVLSVTHFFILFSPIVFVITYLIRVISIRFESIISNVIFMIFNGLLISFLVSILFGSDEKIGLADFRFFAIIAVLLVCEFYIVFKILRMKKALTHNSRHD